MTDLGHSNEVSFLSLKFILWQLCHSKVSWGVGRSSYSPATEDFISCEHENKGSKIIGKYHGYTGRNREQLANNFFKPSLLVLQTQLSTFLKHAE